MASFVSRTPRLLPFSSINLTEFVLMNSLIRNLGPLFEGAGLLFFL